jgi:hypothetical protein
MKTWNFCALLPNLCLKEAIGNDTMLTVPYDDIRLQKMAAADSRLCLFLEGFSDPFGRKRFPSAIISRLQTAPLPGDDVIDFRNAVATSCVVGGAQNSVLVQPPMSTVFPLGHSDYFELYPMFLPGDGKRAFLTSSYAGIGLDTELERFRGQTSPRLHNVEAGVPVVDSFLLDALMAAWKALYIDGRPVDNRVIGLFRSLQVAFHAAALLSKNEASMHDFGVSVSQWVSATEILLHPEKKDVRKRQVLDVLAGYPWQEPALRQTMKTLPATRHHNAVLLNAAQVLFHQLCETRNDFVHGNDLHNAPHHYPLHDKTGPGWLVVAPLVYKVALSCFFGQYDNNVRFEEAFKAILNSASNSAAGLAVN